MPKVQRKGDPNMFGGLITSGDNSVLINGRPAATPNTPVTPHPPCSPKNPIHCVAVTRGGSPKVFVNKKPLLTSGDKDLCGDSRFVSGSPNVNAFGAGGGIGIGTVASLAGNFI
jgi:uncharacterized Zn-binding protein involved in type VI secretion